MALGQGKAALTSGEDTTIQLMADAKGSGMPLVHFWGKVAGAGRANEGLRATWQEELEMAGRYDGFQYVRFHGIFHDDMWVYREDKEGRPLYNFQYIDDLYDRMLSKGIRPFVELGLSPSEIATVKNTTFWWHPNGSPPTDNNKWAALVKAVWSTAWHATEWTRSGDGTSRYGTSRICMSRSFAEGHSRSTSSCTRLRRRQSRRLTRNCA